MKRFTKCGFTKTICMGFVLSLILSVVTVTKASAASGDVANVELNKLANWVTGDLDSNGSLIANKRRITSIDYYRLDDEKYNVSVSNSSYQLNAYLYDANKNFIKSETLCDGYTFVKLPTYSYVKFTLRNTAAEKSMSYGQFGSRLGLEVKLSFLPVVDADAPIVETEAVEEHEYFEGFDSKAISDWVTGDLSAVTGEVAENKRRITAEDTFPVYHQDLNVQLSSSDYRLKVMEYDEDMEVLTVTVAASGQDIKVKEDTRFVRFSLYRTYSEKSLSMGQWGSIFSSGLKIAVTTDEVSEKIVTAPEPDKSPVTEPAPIVSDIYEVLKEMLYTGEMSARDISGLKVSINDVHEAFSKLIQGEGRLYYAASSNIYISNLNAKNGICTTVQIAGMDADHVNRYNRMVKSINEIMGRIDPRMSDLEKVLVVHDYLTETVKYDSTTAMCGTAGGALGDRKAKCLGYAYAFNTVMQELNIKSYTLTSKDMNHAWNYVEIDGQVYHVDATWDTSNKNVGKVYNRSYLIASDKRFGRYIPSRHYSWVVSMNYDGTRPDVAGTSTKYDSWFVHDVTTKMVYCDGLWYYGKGNTIVRSDINGNNMSVILTESADVCIISLSQGVLKYSVNGVTKSVRVN